MTASGQEPHHDELGRVTRSVTKRDDLAVSLEGQLQDANTRALFGDYISVYDIQRAVQDGATVPIYYESRLAKLALDETERPSREGTNRSRCSGPPYRERVF
jgi:SWI2/SNF2 ATPase-like protein